MELTCRRIKNRPPSGNIFIVRPFYKRCIMIIDSGAQRKERYKLTVHSIAAKNMKPKNTASTKFYSYIGSLWQLLLEKQINLQLNFPLPKFFMRKYFIMYCPCQEHQVLIRFWQCQLHIHLNMVCNSIII